MRYRALVCDYDLTLVDEDGHLSPETVASLRQLKASGRRICIITGRRMDDIASTLSPDEAALFDVIVAENGGVIWWPGSGRCQTIAPMVPPEFVRALSEARVPASIGTTGVHVPRRFGPLAQGIAGRLNLPLHAIIGTNHYVFVANGIDKAWGLREAMRSLGLKPRDAVVMGDGFNDVALLSRRHSGCGLSVAVGNAVPAAKLAADRVAQGGPGAAVREVIEALLGHGLRVPADLGLAA